MGMMDIRRRILLNNPHIETANGAVASFNTGLTLPVKELQIGIEPVQTGEGDPYPPGGSNNLIPDGTDTENGYVNRRYIEIDGTTTASANWYVSEYFSVSPDTAYTMSFNRPTIPQTVSVCFYDGNKTFISGVNFNGSSPVAITTPSDAVYARCSQYKADGYLVQFETGSTATEIKPYSNIRPISGWTGCNVRRAGINLTNGEEVKNTILDKIGSSRRGISKESPSWVWFTPNATDGYPCIFGPLNYSQNYNYKENTRYTFAFQVTSQNDVDTLNIGVSYTDGTSRGFKRSDIVDGNWIVYTTDENKSVRSFYIGLYSSSRWTSINYKTMGVYEGVVTLSDIQEQRLNTYEITFPNEAGTVYGGTLTIDKDGNGELAVDWKCRKIDQNISWASTGSGNSKYFYNDSLEEYGAIVGGADYTMSDTYKVISVTSSGTGIGFSFWNRAANEKARFSFRPLNPSQYSTTSLKTFLQDNPFYICYKMSTPTIYTLTASQIRTLFGQNNIWADAGDIIKCDYWKQ